MGRAAVQNAAARRIVSGGSTISQQLARIAWKDILPGNRYARKACEILLALKLEYRLPKERILECWLNRVPMKYNQAGFPAAAKRIFGRDIRFLTREELASLVILIRQNTVTEKKFDARFLRLWKRVATAPPRNVDTLRKAVFEPPPFTPVRANSSTLHFESWLRASNPGLSGNVRTCISGNLNEQITRIVNSELLFLERYDTENAAVVALDLTAEDRLPLAAMVGSRNFNGSIDGQVNGCLSVREAGSSLKPLLYALAMDEKGYLPNTIIDDREQGYPADGAETYIPKNYDLAYWGPLTIREALGASRNIPAVSMIRAVGVPAFYTLLRKAGFDHMTYGPDHYGHGLALGAGGASLMQLARVYAAIARGGMLLPVLVGEDRRGSSHNGGYGRPHHERKNGALHHRDPGGPRDQAARLAGEQELPGLPVRSGGKDRDVKGLPRRMDDRLHHALRRGRMGRQLLREAHEAGLRLMGLGPHIPPGHAAPHREGAPALSPAGRLPSP